MKDLITVSLEPPTSLGQVSGQVGLPSTMAALDQAGDAVPEGPGGGLETENSSFVDKYSLSMPWQVSQVYFWRGDTHTLVVGEEHSTVCDGPAA